MFFVYIVTIVSKNFNAHKPIYIKEFVVSILLYVKKIIICIN